MSGAEKMVRVPLAELTTDPANARKHDARNLEAIRASLRRFGQQHPLIVDRSGVVVAGNGRLEAMRAEGWEDCMVIYTELEGADRAAFAIADNRTAELAEWEDEVLRQTLASIDDELRTAAGFIDEEFAALTEDIGNEAESEIPEAPEAKVDRAAELLEKWWVQRGDLWLLGEHRLLCGDSTSADQVARLFGDETATMVHADPPYGMGKEKDGVANDNLYREKLDAFQMEWWSAWRSRLADNGSAYIWGNAPDLWRLWYCGGLADSERLTMRNEVVWDKGGAAAGGVSLEGSEGPRKYPLSTERCLFFMLGEQGFNINADNYWEGWEPIRAYLVEQFERCGWKTKGVAEWLGVNPRTVDHWVSRSQWAFITEEHYRKVQKAAREHDAFKREYDELKREHDELKREHDDLKREFYATRAYFDNTHDNMTDVWSFGRVVGDERHGHATPKPVQMVARAILSSSREGDIVSMPFGGTGPELIAAEQLGRKCYGMELEPAYCAVILERASEMGLTPVRSDG